MRNAGDRNPSRAIFLSILMIIMTQVGYLDTMNPWSNDDETLDESNDVLETGGAGSSGGNGSVWQVADIHSSEGSLVA